MYLKSWILRIQTYLDKVKDISSNKMNWYLFLFVWWYKSRRMEDNMDYAMKVYPVHFENGKAEWCVEYPDLKGCVGGGDTIEEAIDDAEASKNAYLSYLKENEKQCSKSWALFKLIGIYKIG